MNDQGQGTHHLEGEYRGRSDIIHARR